MTIYLGPPGNLQALPSVGRGISAGLDLGAATQRTLSGARTVDYVGNPKRTYSMERRYLTADELSVIEGLALGAYGDPGSLVLLDPWRRNMLSANQSSGGDYSRDTTGFRVTGSSTALSAAGPDATTAARGLYVQRVTYTGTTQTPALQLGDVTSAATVIASGIPCLPSTSYVFSALVRHVSGTAASWRAAVKFYDSAGLVVNDVGGTSSLLTGSFGQRVAAATSGSTAAYMIPRVAAGGVLAAAETVDVDDFMLEQASAVSSWVLGTGVPRVAFTELGNSHPVAGYEDATITLQEVG